MPALGGLVYGILAMKWPFFSRRSQVNEAWLERYQALRRQGLLLTAKLAKQLPKSAVPEFGKKIGLFKAGTLILNNDDEIAILYDYCIYHYRRADKTVLERYLETASSAENSDESMLLKSMQNARYSVFRVSEVKPRQGARILDLVRGDELELVDTGVAESAGPSMILLGRLLPVESFYMSTGTLIPLAEPAYLSAIQPILNKFLGEDPKSAMTQMSATQESAYVGQLIRAALQAGGIENVFYTDTAPVAE